MPPTPPDSTAAALFALTNALQPVRRAWVQAAGVAFERSGLSVSLATIVLIVARHDEGVRQSILAEEVGVNPGAIVRTLDQGEAAGLLERRDVPGNRRIKTVHVLAEGFRLAAIMEGELSRLRLALLDDLPVEDVQGATRVLRLFEERIAAFLQQERSRR